MSGSPSDEGSGPRGDAAEASGAAAAEKSRVNPSVDRVVLTGFMGAGKSATGRELGLLLRWEFIDLDDRIVSRTGLSVSEIFAHFGELKFRELESGTAAGLLERQHIVLALGGGAVEAEGLLERVEASGSTLLVYLQAPLADLLVRCQRQNGRPKRPLLSDMEDVGTRYLRRLPIYQRAHLTIDTVGLSPRAAAQRIAAIVSNPPAR